MNVFIGNLSWGTDEDSLLNVLEQYGEVENLRIITDRETGRSRGFAFATFREEDQAQEAIQALNGQELDGRNLNVNEARERQPRQRARSW